MFSTFRNKLRPAAGQAADESRQGDFRASPSFTPPGWPLGDQTTPCAWTSPSTDERGPFYPETNLKPFLSLTPRVLLTAFYPPLLVFLFTIAHMFKTRSSSDELAARLKDSVLAACTGLATGAGSLQAIPRYLAMQSNDHVLRATRATVLGVGTALMNCITVIAKVVVFIIDMYRSLLLCTIELVIRGTLEVVISMVKQVTSFIEQTLGSIRTAIQNDLAAGNDLIQKAAAAVNGVTSKFGVDISVPDISIPSLSFLQNVQIPTTFEDSLVSLNRSIPSLAELKERMNDLVETPFDALSAQINSTRLRIAAELNSSTFPVPSLESLGASDSQALRKTLCSDLDTSLIDDTASALHRLGTIGIAIMFVCFFAGWGIMGLWQWYRWRALCQSVEAIEEEWKASDTRDPWMVVAAVENPIVNKIIHPIQRRLSLGNRSRINLRWFLSYLGHPTCLSLLVISCVGLITLEVQLAALKGLKRHAAATAHAEMESTTADMVSRLNAVSANISTKYAADMNAALARIEDQVNGELFGTWINSTAVTLNTTLAEFYDEVEHVLNVTFGGTVLYDAINTFVYCIVGSKIDALEQGLTWVSKHADISFPTVPDDILQLSNSAMKEMVEPIASAALGGNQDDGGGALGSLIGHFESALRAERVMYGILLGAYGVLVLAGLLGVMWRSGGSERWQALRR